jgi:hypothetical protein
LVVRSQPIVFLAANARRHHKSLLPGRTSFPVALSKRASPLLPFYFYMSFDSLPNITNIFNVGDMMQQTNLKKLVPQPKQYKKGPYTVEAKGYEKIDGETIPRVHPSAKDGLISTPAPDVKTIYDILRSSSKKFGNAKALGYRTLIKTHEEVKQIKKVVDGKEVTEDKKWQFSELSSYTYISFVEYEQLCFKVASGYRALGMNKGDRVHIFASTSPWWLATAHGKYPFPNSTHLISDMFSF